MSGTQMVTSTCQPQCALGILRKRVSETQTMTSHCLPSRCAGCWRWGVCITEHQLQPHTLSRISLANGNSSTPAAETRASSGQNGTSYRIQEPNPKVTWTGVGNQEGKPLADICHATEKHHYQEGQQGPIRSPSWVVYLLGFQRNRIDKTNVCVCTHMCIVIYVYIYSHIIYN